MSRAKRHEAFVKAMTKITGHKPITITLKWPRNKDVENYLKMLRDVEKKSRKAIGKSKIRFRALVTP